MADQIGLFEAIYSQRQITRYKPGSGAAGRAGAYY